MTSSSHNHPKVPARDEDGRLIRQEDWNFLAERCDTLAKTLAAKDAEIERLTNQLGMLHIDVLSGFVGLGQCTPEEGFIKAPHCVDQCFALAKSERDRLAAEVERLKRELAAAHDESAKRGSEILDLQQENEKLRNTIQTLSERLTAALEAKSTAETESQRANEFVNVFRADMEKLAAENAELRRDAEQCRGRAKRYRTWITEQFTGGLPLHVAQKLDLCRICGQVPSIPLVLNYGKEYACQKCLDELDAALKEAK